MNSPFGVPDYFKNPDPDPDPDATVLNPSRKACLHELGNEFGISPSQVKEELGQFSNSGLLASEKSGRKIYYW